jgi:hypothetical protein
VTDACRFRRTNGPPTIAKGGRGGRRINHDSVWPDATWCCRDSLTLLHGVGDDGRRLSLSKCQGRPLRSFRRSTGRDQVHKRRRPDQLRQNHSAITIFSRGPCVRLLVSAGLFHHCNRHSLGASGRESCVLPPETNGRSHHATMIGKRRRLRLKLRQWLDGCH